MGGYLLNNYVRHNIYDGPTFTWLFINAHYKHSRHYICQRIGSKSNSKCLTLMENFLQHFIFIISMWFWISIYLRLRLFKIMIRHIQYRIIDFYTFLTIFKRLYRSKCLKCIHTIHIFKIFWLKMLFYSSWLHLSNIRQKVTVMYLYAVIKAEASRAGTGVCGDDFCGA